MIVFMKFETRWQDVIFGTSIIHEIWENSLVAFSEPQFTGCLNGDIPTCYCWLSKISPSARKVCFYSRERTCPEAAVARWAVQIWQYIYCFVRWGKLGTDPDVRCCTKRCLALMDRQPIDRVVHCAEADCATPHNSRACLHLCSMPCIDCLSAVRCASVFPA